MNASPSSSLRTLLPDWRAAAAMALALAVLAVGWRIPLPGLSRDALAQIASSAGDSTYFSIFALYLTPVLTVLAYVEIAKLVFPPLERWTQASALNARRQDVAILVLCLMLAIFYGGGVLLALAAGGLADADSVGFVVTGLACFLAGTALLVWLNDRLRSKTLGEGFWFLLAALFIAGLLDEAIFVIELAGTGAVAGGGILLLGLSLVAAMALTVFAMRLVETKVDASGVARTSLLLWPPLLGGAVAGHLVAAFPADTPGWPLGWPPFGQTVYLALGLLCIPVFVVLYARRFRATRERAGVQWPLPVLLAVIAIQVVLCGGVWLVQAFIGVPPGIWGNELLVIGSVLLALRGSRSA